MLQGFPGCHWLKDVLLVEGQVEPCIDWLLNINEPYLNLTAEQMTLMIKSGHGIELILQRIESCKTALDTVLGGNPFFETDVEAERAWKAKFGRVMYEYFGFNRTCIETIWDNADKLLHGEMLQIIAGFEGKKVGRILDIVGSCTKDKANVTALQ